MNITRIVGMLTFTIIGLGALTGCRVVSIKPEGRSATDQFLVARSMEGALAKMNIGAETKDQKVELIVSGLGIDQEYMTEIAKAWIKLQGGKLVAAEAESDMKLHLIVQAAGSDTEESKWELPIGIPTFSTEGGLSLSRLLFFSKKRQVARCHMWAYAENTEGDVLHTQSPVQQVHYVANRELFGITLGRGSDLNSLSGYELVGEDPPNTVPVLDSSGEE